MILRLKNGLVLNAGRMLICLHWQGSKFSLKPLPWWTKRRVMWKRSDSWHPGSNRLNDWPKKQLWRMGEKKVLGIQFSSLNVSPEVNFTYILWAAFLQFQQQFTSSFFADFLLPNNYRHPLLFADLLSANSLIYIST